MTNQTASIGLFDSGVGGLSVMEAVRRELPDESILYFADQAHVPYGLRQLEEVRKFSEEISRFLIDQGCKEIIVACNAASAAALNHLRTRFPQMLFVGMEPAVKPAAETTRSKVVGVLATPATFQGELYASVVERFATGVEILTDTCPGLVQQIEAGELTTQTTRVILERALLPMLSGGVDTIVLACTHYPFVIPLIRQIVGNSVRVIDPAPAVARQARRLLEMNALTQTSTPPSPQALPGSAAVQVFTSGDRKVLSGLIRQLIQQDIPVYQVAWHSEDTGFSTI